MRADADDAEDRRGRARDEAGQREDAGALEIERRGGREQEQEGHREHDESARRLRAARRSDAIGGTRRSRVDVRQRRRRSARRIHANTYPAIASVSTAGQT